MLFKKILRAITSRYFISLAFIGIELFLLFWLQSYLNDYLFAFYVLSYIISVLTLLFIINSEPSNYNCKGLVQDAEDFIYNRTCNIRKSGNHCITEEPCIMCDKE